MKIPSIRQLKRYRPGEICPISGQWTLSNGQQATVVKGEPMPPTPRPNMKWRLTDRTR